MASRYWSGTRLARQFSSTTSVTLCLVCYPAIPVHPATLIYCATVAESYSLSPGTEPPSIFTIEMERPPKYKGLGWPRSEVRPIPVTASICLDFASSSSFTALDAAPALVLAPASTWHPRVGEAMWAQAQARAAETGATVVWCDGGRGGLSGVASGGRAGTVVQVGPGTWSLPVAIPHPFDASRRTVYARGGQLGAFFAVWAVAGVGLGVEAVQRRVGVRLGWVVVGVRRAAEALLRRRGAQQGAAPPQGNLLDL
jgi:hypothetical protein